MKSKVPNRAAIAETQGPAQVVWDNIIDEIGSQYGDLNQEWKPSKTEFGWMCALKQKKRTLVYLTPEVDAVRVGIVLGERASQQSLASNLPEDIKELIRQARPYAEGRGIRFSVKSIKDAHKVMDLIALKMAP